MERFVAKLKEIGYRGPMNIERETPDHAERLRDIAMGVELLARIRAAL
jgi:sugar phosphate isomerase/epimerase